MYQQFYDNIQKRDIRISRKIIRPLVEEVTGKRVRWAIYGFDATKLRGLFLPEEWKDFKIVQQMGTNVILTARGLDKDWERFIYTKELMHLFDSEEEKTTTAADFIKLLNQLTTGPALGQASPQWISEEKAYWRALCAFCPEKNRVEFCEMRQNNETDNNAISNYLGIPEDVVVNLFRDDFSEIIDLITKE